MPWHQEPMKDAMNCEKPRGVVNKRYIRGYPNGETHAAKSRVPYGESNSHTGGTRRTETSKYREEEKSTEIPRVVASESGRGQTVSSNACGVRTVKDEQVLGERRGKADRRV